MFRSTLTILRPICESCFYNCWLHIVIPLCLQIMPVCMPAISTLKWGETVGGIRSMRGCCVNSRGCRATSLLVFTVQNCLCAVPLVVVAVQHCGY